MILLRISSSNEETTKQVSELLLKENWAIDINYKKNVKRLILNGNNTEEISLFIITAKTKALLFTKIENRFKELFKDDTPEFYALPIVAMETNQTEALIAFTKKI